MIINFPKLGQTEGGGGGDTPTGDASLPVRFLDYDGTVVYSYTKGDFASLSALPANPSHDGLTAQGWNWSLADAQAYVAKYGMLDIGQMYITDDGKTRLYLSIKFDNGRDAVVYFSQTVANGVTVDWGDASEPETTTGTGNKSLTHTYAAPGDYVVTLSCSSGTMKVGNESYSVMGLRGSSGDRYYQGNMLRKVEVGVNVTYVNLRNSFLLTSITLPLNFTGSLSAGSCYQLQSITLPSNLNNLINNSLQETGILSISIPKNFTTLNNYVFQDCKQLRRLLLPANITALPQYSIYDLYSLETVVLPENLAKIDGYSFNAAYSLLEYTIPSGVTQIGNTLGNFYSVKKIFVLPEVPPTLANSSPWGLSPSELVIYVPAASVEAYKAATNWSKYASKIQPIPES